MPMQPFHTNVKSQLNSKLLRSRALAFDEIKYDVVMFGDNNLNWRIKTECTQIASYGIFRSAIGQNHIIIELHFFHSSENLKCKHFLLIRHCINSIKQECQQKFLLQRCDSKIRSRKSINVILPYFFFRLAI